MRLITILALCCSYACTQTVTPLVGALKALRGKTIYQSGDGELHKDKPLSEFVGEAHGSIPGKAFVLREFKVDSAEYDGNDLVLLHLTDEHELNWVSPVDKLKLIGPSASGLRIALAMSGWWLEIPKTLSAQEVTAIKRGNLFVGMSQDAVAIELGKPQRKRVSAQTEMWEFQKDSALLTFDAQTKKLLSYTRDE